ncbi:hypothetical protein AVEN_120539-1 [Araneus ventricosus]|uniref:Uncharacterized protein n=1 Tax=Araneus ventricosus TaxID=182803 RepID=A0A4Y2UEN5_ARAVE|nr:hypothetical protein AVEN_120539-1 [Araneus ventricosus]
MTPTYSAVGGSQRKCQNGYRARLTRLWFYESKSIVIVERSFRYSIEIFILQVRTPSIVGNSSYLFSEFVVWRHNGVYDVLTGDRECPSLKADSSSELISATSHWQKAFVKDDSLSQLILVGNISNRNIELAAIFNIAKSVCEMMLSVYERQLCQLLDRLMEQLFRTEKELEVDIVSLVAKLQRNCSELNDELNQ